MLAAALATYLDSEGVVTFDPAGVTGNAFIDELPDGPEVAVSIREVPGRASEIGVAEVNNSVQVLVRGSRSPRTAHDLAWAIYDALHGQINTTLGSPDYYFVLCQAAHVPGSIGQDDNRRHLYSINFNLITGRTP
jgi:hypothetical protein